MFTRLGPTLWGHSDIQAIKDLRGLKTVSRQRGADTWVLFDYLLGPEGIKPSETPGYDHEVAIYLAAVLAVKNKDVDLAVDVESVAIRMGLGSIYLQDEDYEFVLKKEGLKLEPIQKLVQTLESQVFRNVVGALGGYTIFQSGHVRYYGG